MVGERVEVGCGKKLCTERDSCLPAPARSEPLALRPQSKQIRDVFELTFFRTRVEPNFQKSNSSRTELQGSNFEPNRTFWEMSNLLKRNHF